MNAKGTWMKKHKVFYKDIEIRASDLNRVGHVANPVYFSYFDEGWLAFYKEVLKRSLNDICALPVTSSKMADKIPPWTISGKPS